MVDDGISAGLEDGIGVDDNVRLSIMNPTAESLHAALAACSAETDQERMFCHRERLGCQETWLLAGTA